LIAKVQKLCGLTSGKTQKMQKQAKILGRFFKIASILAARKKQI
jgi:hypothetical protein